MDNLSLKSCLIGTITSLYTHILQALSSEIFISKKASLFLHLSKTKEDTITTCSGGVFRWTIQKLISPISSLTRATCLRLPSVTCAPAHTGTRWWDVGGRRRWSLQTLEASGLVSLQKHLVTYLRNLRNPSLPTGPINPRYLGFPSLSGSQMVFLSRYNTPCENLILTCCRLHTYTKRVGIHSQYIHISH